MSLEPPHGVIQDPNLSPHTKRWISELYKQLVNVLEVNDATFTGNIDAGSATQVDLGNFVFDTDQTVGAGQDNHVLTYDNSSGEISLESAFSAITSWNPTLAGSSSDPTQSYSAQAGEYMRLGNMVVVWGYVQMAGSGISSGSGNLELSSLPLSVGGSGGHLTVTNSSSWGTTVGAPTSGLGGSLGPSGDRFDMKVYDNDAGNIAGVSSASAADVTNSTRMDFFGIYETDA